MKPWDLTEFDSGWCFPPFDPDKTGREGRFGFTVAQQEGAGGGLDIHLPHQCDSWAIHGSSWAWHEDGIPASFSGAAKVAEAIADLKRFLQEGLEALRFLHVNKDVLAQRLDDDFARYLQDEREREAREAEWHKEAGLA